jgi:hypothetical protein
MKEIDVTNKITYSEFDVGMLMISRCFCGEEFDYGDLIINDDKRCLVECEKCGRKFYFTNEIKVIMVEE